tara:strand:- start:5 stop:232 length:228 start_codon:yes stop_codon:yes gene_type:complete
MDKVTSSPACQGPPSKDGEEWPAPMNMADVMAIVSVALVVDEVLAPDDVQTKTPGLEIIDTDILVVPEIGMEVFS